MVKTSVVGIICGREFSILRPLFDIVNTHVLFLISNVETQADGFCAGYGATWEWREREWPDMSVIID